MLQSLFSSRVRVRVLTHLFSHPDQPFYARSLAREIVSSSTNRPLSYAVFPPSRSEKNGLWGRPLRASSMV